MHVATLFVIKGRTIHRYQNNGISRYHSVSKNCLAEKQHRKYPEYELDLAIGSKRLSSDSENLSMQLS